ncbi:hypothetical protein C8F01DRAFT_1375148 [Mycena amicta]|nr:hypothetical protein C8F01DRAFT_1375148 [Mycena amicta]
MLGGYVNCRPLPPAAVGRPIILALTQHPDLPPHLHHRLTDIDAAIAALRVERGTILGELHTTPSLINLTPEIIAEIFLWFAAEEPIRGPFLLAVVCKRWREIALACPRLWTKLFVPEKDSSSRYQDRTHSMIERFLQRSAALPLEVSIESMDFAGLAGVDLFVQRAHRLRSLAFAVKTPDQAELFNSVSLFPVLERIRITITVSGWTSHPSYPVPGLLHPIQIVPLPWSQLETLHLDMDFTPPCLSCISQATNVVDLTLWLRYPAGQTTVPAPAGFHITMLRLRALRICYVHVLDWLTAPLLESLHIRDEAIDAEATITVRNFVLRSDCNLTGMNFAAPSLNDTENVLLHLPFLTTLHIDCNGLEMVDVDELLHWLSLPDGDIVPHLEALSLKAPSNECISMRSLASMLRARRLQPVRVGLLNKLTLCCPSDRSYFDVKQAFSRMRELRMQGMIFEFDQVPMWSTDGGLDALMVEKIMQ